MKKLIMILALGLIAGQIQAQKIKENEVPAAVKTAFGKAYPTAKEVKWDKEDGGYEASFDQNKKETSIVLDASGKITEVENEIAKSELPKTTQDVLTKDYAGYKIEETAKIVAGGAVSYEVEVEKGKISYELIFDNNGKLLKKTEKKEKAGDKD